MLAFGTAIADRAKYDEIALPGIERVAEPDSLILTREGYDSIQQPYNEMMDEAAARPDLEALILPHEDLELADDELPSRIRRVFSDPRVGLLGALGGRPRRLHCWLESSQQGFGFVLGREGLNRNFRLTIGPHEVEGVDGALLILAPWAVRSVRFNEAMAELFHGYDVDIASRVKAQRGKVICEDIVCHHHSQLRTLGDDSGQLAQAGAVLAQMWDPALRPLEWAPSFQD